MIDKKLNLLIADDEIYVRIIVKAYFAPYDLEIFEAKDGKEAMQILKSEEIDLLILDYLMPSVNGQEVINRMQLDEKLSKIPVILYSAGGYEEEIENWLKMSSMAYVEKTNIGEELLPTVKDILGSRLKSKN
ncbi:response regulator [Elusimicrobiota bacterium]